MSLNLLRVAAIAAVLVTTAACQGLAPAADGPQPIDKVYDPQTGRLTLLTYDTKKSDRIDTWCYMDGTLVARIELDRDGDGKVDRWEYYGPDQKLQKIGMSRANDGAVDAWAYSAPDGSLARLEIATNRDGKVTRTEYYEAGVLARVEEDGDRDGRVDKWETYASGRLTSVSLDTQHRGTPDRRLAYLPDGSVKSEAVH